MKIDFETIAEQRLPEFKGGTGTTVARIYADDTIRILNGCLEKGSSIGIHTHEGTSETVYILSGVGKMICDGNEEPLKAGSCSYCPEGHRHSLVNIGEEPLYFLGIIPKLGSPD